MAFTSLAVANEFLRLAQADNESLTPMKLQKLVYYAHGWYLALNEQPLIFEQVEAWQFGPVIPSLYHHFKEYGNNPIAGYTVPGELEPLPWMGFRRRDIIPMHQTYVRTFLKKIWDTYKGYTGIQLSNMTHEPGTPWDSVNQEYDGRIPPRTDIPAKTIKKFFDKEAQRT